MRMEFDRIDHVVFSVRDIAATCDFSARAFGLRVLTFNDGRHALQVGQCQINLHQQGHEFEPKALRYFRVFSHLSCSTSNAQRTRP